MLYDAFVYKNSSDDFLIDCDLPVVGDMLFHLRQYRLRSKVDLDDVSASYSILCSWNHDASEGLSAGTIVDSRCPDWTMTRRVIPKDLSYNSDASIYNMLRMTKGIPEGPMEIPRTKAIPLEFNMDLMGAVDTHKGCYMGQELVARTLNRGVVRKRILPVRLHEWNSDRASYTADASLTFSGIESESDLMPVEPRDAQGYPDVTTIESTRSFGKLIRIVGNTGIALVRLAEIPPHGLFAVHRPTPDDGKPTFVLGETIIPSWWPSSVRSS
jgi:mRNA-decapping enzyme subunit 2